MTEALAHRLTRNDCSTKVGLHVVLRCFCQNQSGGEIRKIRKDNFYTHSEAHCLHRDMFRMRMSEPLHQRWQFTALLNSLLLYKPIGLTKSVVAQS